LRISDRWLDYALVGGFFWLWQVALAGVTFGEDAWTGFCTALKGGLDILPGPALSPLTALLGALALIAVFVTGVLLDLLASAWLRSWELMAFTKYLRENKTWLETFVQANRSYIQEDWRTLVDMPSARRQWIVGIGIYVELAVQA
jgi:hypothetical protein